MSWYDSTDKEVDELALHDAQLRLWISVVILSLREYQTLHRLGYLEDGRITEKCKTIGKLTLKKDGRSYYSKKVISISSASDVHQLVEFLKGDGLSIVMRYCNMKDQTQDIIRNGLKKIEAGETPIIMSHEPDAIDRSIHLFRPSPRKKRVSACNAS
jgi:hypothetical protein